MLRSWGRFSTFRAPLRFTRSFSNVAAVDTWKRYNEAGVFYLQRNELDKAEHMFRTCLKLEGNNDPALDLHRTPYLTLSLANLGISLRKQTKYDEARRILDQARKQLSWFPKEVNPKQIIAVHTELAHCTRELQDWLAASDSLELILELLGPSEITVDTSAPVLPPRYARTRSTNTTTTTATPSTASATASSPSSPTTANTTPTSPNHTNTTTASNTAKPNTNTTTTTNNNSNNNANTPTDPTAAAAAVSAAAAAAPSPPTPAPRALNPTANDVKRATVTYHLAQALHKHSLQLRDKHGKVTPESNKLLQTAIEQYRAARQLMQYVAGTNALEVAPILTSMVAALVHAELFDEAEIRMFDAVEIKRIHECEDLQDAMAQYTQVGLLRDPSQAAHREKILEELLENAEVPANVPRPPTSIDQMLVKNTNSDEIKKAAASKK